ncbi:MAG: hypothetical protein AAGJ52_13260 [Pseudomonadota bacterium]
MQILRTTFASLLLFAFLTGCATYPTPRYGDDGVYGTYGLDNYQRAPHFRGSSAWYPYWSLDHFYFSHFYAPYSVIVHPWDPWLFPYSAWYWNYPYSHHRFFVGGPWHYWGPWSYRHHRPWHYRRYDRHYPDSIDYRSRRVAFDSGEWRTTNRHREDRLERFEQQRRARSDGGGGVQRQRPVTRQPSRAPVSRRAPSSSRPSPASRSRSARMPERIRERPPQN